MKRRLIIIWTASLLVLVRAAGTLTGKDDEGGLDEDALVWNDCWDKYLPGQSEELKKQVAFECAAYSAPLYRNAPEQPNLYKTQLKTVRVRYHPSTYATKTPSDDSSGRKKISIWMIPGGPGQGLQSVELSNAVRYLELFPEEQRPLVSVYVTQIRFFEYNLGIIKDLRILRQVLTLNEGYPLEWISTNIAAQDFLDVVHAVVRDDPGEHRHYVHGISYGFLVALEALRKCPEGMFAGILSDAGATPEFRLNEFGVNMSSILEEALEVCQAVGDKCPTDLKTLVNGVRRPNLHVKEAFMQRFCRGKEFEACVQELADYAIHMTQVDTKLGAKWQQTSVPFILFALLTLLARGGTPQLITVVFDTLDLTVLEAMKQDRLTRHLGRALAPKDSELDESMYLRPNIMVYTKIILSELWIDPMREPERIMRFMDSAPTLCKLLFSRQRAQEADAVLNLLFRDWANTTPWFLNHRKYVDQQTSAPLPRMPSTKFLFISAGMDSQVPAFQIRQFSENLRNAGNPLVTYLHFPHARHMPVVTCFKEPGMQALLKDFFLDGGVVGPVSKYPLPDLDWNLITPLFVTLAQAEELLIMPSLKSIPPRKPFGKRGPTLSEDLAPLEPETLPVQIKIAFGCLIATSLVTLVVFLYWLSIQVRLISVMRGNALSPAV